MHFGNPRTTEKKDSTSATVYFHPAEEGKSPELLLFEEEPTHRRNWKEKASARGKQLWARTKEKLDHITSDIFASDRFVRRLKRLKKITVLLNKPIDPGVVRERLHAIIRDRTYHHLRWLIIDSVLLPFSILIVPLPGPNLIGYYLLFRVYSHWKSFRSASNANVHEIDVQVSNRAEEVHTTLRGAKDIRTALHELRKKYGLRALQEHEFIPQRSILKEAWTRMRKAITHEDNH